jgi:excisionase family DNA binding protein
VRHPDIHPDREHEQEGTPPMTTTTGPLSAPTPIVLTVEQAAQRLGIGRTLMYSLVSSGAVESVTIGRLRRIPADALVEYVNRLRSESGDEGAAA